MKPTSCVFLTVVLALVVLAIVTCRGDLPTTTERLEPLDVPVIQGVEPVNGASAVRRNSSYMVKFDDSMDTASVASSFHMIGGQDMIEWLDSLGDRSHSELLDSRWRQRMMDWLDSIRTPGQFSWNEDCDSCRFRPDTLLLSDAQYIVFITDEMCNAIGGHLKTDHLLYDGYMFYFKTRP